MLKKTVEYTDYNGVSRKEDFYFNLTKAECTEMELGTEGGLAAKMQKIIDAQNMPEIIKTFKEIVLASYGIKSDDGKRFMKSDTIREEFSQTEAYSIIFMELATDENAATNFINGILPADLPRETPATIAANSN